MVYVITDNSGFVKIGSTTDLSSRIKQLQIGNPRNLKVLYEIPFGGVELEHALHIRYAEYRISVSQLETCEWFKDECLEDFQKLTSDDLMEIERIYGRSRPVYMNRVVKPTCICAELQKTKKHNDKLSAEVRNKRREFKPLKSRVEELERENKRLAKIIDALKYPPRVPETPEGGSDIVHTYIISGETENLKR